MTHTIGLFYGSSNQFMGLSLDEDHQSDLTAERLNRWARQVLSEFGLLEEVPTV